MLPRWELSFYLFASLGFHFYSFYEVFKVSREHEEELDQEFDLETDSLFGGLKKDPTDFEWSFWMEWGKQRLAWLLLGHVGVSQVANLLARKHRPWILAAYGMWACHCALGTRGTAMVLLHTTISFCVAQFRSLALSWLCSLFLLSTLRLQDVEEVKRGWYETENEYYLLQFTLTVRCLYYTSFSLELCWQQLPAERAFYSFPWMVAYVFYYPVFHNGPILSFPEFLTQMQPREQGSLKASFSILVRGLGRLLFYWWLVELMVHLMYMHAICSSAPLLSAVSCWTLGPRGGGHVEVPALGTESELQLLAYTTAIATQDPSRICDLHHSSRQCRILNPLSRARDRTHNLMVPSQIRFCCAATGTPQRWILNPLSEAGDQTLVLMGTS